MFANFGEIPAMTLQDIKETKRYGRTIVFAFSVRMLVCVSVNFFTTVCRGYKYYPTILKSELESSNR